MLSGKWRPFCLGLNVLSTGDSSLITLIHLNASGIMKVVDDTN